VDEHDKAAFAKLIREAMNQATNALLNAMDGKSADVIPLQRAA
jgi:DNA-binding protein YbaB